MQTTDAAVLDIVKNTLGRLSEAIEALAMKAPSNSESEGIYYAISGILNSEIEAIEDRIDSLSGAANELSEDEEIDEDELV